MIAFFLNAGRTRVLAAAGILTALIAVADWGVGTKASLGLLYIVPMMLGAVVLAPHQTAFLALLCSVLRALFDLPSPPVEALLRFLFSTVAYTSSGLFVLGLIRNRELVLKHLARIRREQDLRHELEQQLKDLVESSPAAILTTDAAGAVLASNAAADTLFLIPKGETLLGKRIGNYIPILADALALEGGEPGFRTAAQCPGRRANGEIFLAHTWFSCYRTATGKRLAAIVVDSSEEMRDREEEGLKQLIRGTGLPPPRFRMRSETSPARSCCCARI